MSLAGTLVILLNPRSFDQWPTIREFTGTKLSSGAVGNYPDLGCCLYRMILLSLVIIDVLVELEIVFTFE